MLNLAEVKAYLHDYQGPPLKIMEVCGTHTSAIMQNGLTSLISPRLKLVSGPGCPVCITPAAYIDAAVEAAHRPNHKVLAFGDMLRVVGNGPSLSESKGQGANVELFYSPREVLAKAQEEPDTTFVVAAVGFETTLPIYCTLLQELEEREIHNVRFLTSLRRIIPALQWLGAQEPGIDAYILPGHVSIVIGAAAYQPLVPQIQRPMAVAGFSGEHLLLAVYDLVQQIQGGLTEVHNLYPALVSEQGNSLIQELVERYFRPSTANWRGLGTIAESGYELRPEYARFAMTSTLFTEEEPSTSTQSSFCRCGEVLLGRVNPPECPAYGRSCTPEAPQGPCMISAEGSCGIWYRFRRLKGVTG